MQDVSFSHGSVRFSLTRSSVKTKEDERKMKGPEDSHTQSRKVSKAGAEAKAHTHPGSSERMWFFPFLQELHHSSGIRRKEERRRRMREKREMGRRKKTRSYDDHSWFSKREESVNKNHYSTDSFVQQTERLEEEELVAWIGCALFCMEGQSC